MHEDKVRALVGQIQKGDERAKEELVERLAPLVMALATRIASSGEREDFYQLGIIGLLQAVRRFNLSSPTKFTTYAVFRIQGEMKQYRRSHLATVKIGRHLQEQKVILEKLHRRLTQQWGRFPSVLELAQQMGLPEEEIALILEAAQPVAPLTENSLPLSLRQGLTEETELVERITLEESMAKLAPLERALIELRFFLERSQAETARELSLTQRQVSRLEKRILGQLKRYLEV